MCRLLGVFVHFLMRSCVFGREMLKWSSAVSAVIGLLSMSIRAQEVCHISIDSNVAYQAIEGFGTSGAWRAPRVGLWPKEKRQQVLGDLRHHRATAILPGHNASDVG